MYPVRSFSPIPTSPVMENGRRKKPPKKVIPFTIMVIGQPGTGKATFVNTICGQPVLSRGEYNANTAHQDVPLEMITRYVELDEEELGAKVGLTVVEAVGFGHNADNSADFKTIVRYLEAQYDEVLVEESRIKRNPRFKDNRVHVVLYFIDFNGHGLRGIDVETMDQVSKRANLIPVISRADTLTPLERASAKKIIMEDIAHHNIPIYNFPFDPEEDDDYTIDENSRLKETLPFAIVTSRKYAWGETNEQNELHSDISSLRRALLVSHLIDLKELTHDFLYENYRTTRLSQRVAEAAASSTSLKVDEEHLAKEQEKLREIEIRVQMEIEEKRQELLAREKELRDVESALNSKEEKVYASSLPASLVEKPQENQVRNLTQPSLSLDQLKSLDHFAPVAPLTSKLNSDASSMHGQFPMKEEPTY